jgi:nitrite reductase (NADH) small subunit
MAHWINVCKASDLQPDSGVCALVEGQQVAIFHLPKEGALYAIHNYDPIGKANVLSRGIVGDIQGEPVVASPLYKQHFSLLTGQCLEDESVKVPVFSIRLADGEVLVCAEVGGNDSTQGA